MSRADIRRRCEFFSLDLDDMIDQSGFGERFKNLLRRHTESSEELEDHDAPILFFDLEGPINRLLRQEDQEYVLILLGGDHELYAWGVLTFVNRGWVFTGKMKQTHGIHAAIYLIDKNNLARSELKHISFYFGFDNNGIFMTQLYPKVREKMFEYHV